MVPPKVGALVVATHKQVKRPLVTLVFEETPGDSTSQERFHKEYIPPRKYTMPQVRVSIDGKYPLVMPKIPPDVTV
jgi:hypothetical protein